MSTPYEELAAVVAGGAPIRIPDVDEPDDLEADIDDAASDEDEHLAADTGLTPDQIEGNER